MSGGWLQVVTWLLIVAGWWVVNSTTNFREIRKEARSAIDQAKKEVHGISKTAVSYFSDSSLALSDDVKNALELVEVELERLHNYRTSNLSIRFNEFQDSCTGADFESAKRKSHETTSSVIQSILFARNRLIHQLEIHFREQYLHVSARRVLFSNQ